VAEKLHLSDKGLVSDFRLLLADGEQLAGAAAYRYLMRRIWWATPLYLLSIFPVFRTLFDLGYRLFADNRFWISRRCHLPGRSRYGPLKKIGNECLRGSEVLLGEFWGATRQRRAEGEAEVNQLLSGSI